MYRYYDFIIHSLTDDYLDYFCALNTVNRTAMNMGFIVESLGISSRMEQLGNMIGL